MIITAGGSLWLRPDPAWVLYNHNPELSLLPDWEEERHRRVHGDASIPLGGLATSLLAEGS